MELPEKFQPKNPAEDTDVRVPVKDITSKLPIEEFRKTADELGLFPIGQSLMQSLRDAGAQLSGSGVVQVANGAAYITMASLLQVQAKMAQDALSAATPREREKIARGLAYLSNAIDKQNRTLKSGEAQAHVPPKQPEGSWKPHQHVHFHTHAAGSDAGIEIAKNLKPA
jgi:hypothetical protein